MPLVLRSNQRFERLTAEGQKVLDVARRMLADVAALKQTIGAPSGRLAGHLRVGIIPTAEPLAGRITAAFHASQPDVTITFLSKTSDEIESGIVEHALEAGISYLERSRAEQFLARELYSEGYVVLGSEELLGLTSTRISWRKAAALPLVLLNREMQNRRLLDKAFAKAGVVPKVMTESSTLIGMFSHVRQGMWCGIFPSSFAVLLGPLLGSLRVLPLTEPTIQYPVGILVQARKPLPPLAQALMHVIDDMPAIGGSVRRGAG